MHTYFSRLLCIVCVICTMQAYSAPLPGNVYDVTAYGAKGDSATIASPAINKAIDAAAAAGGGTVYIPAGKYLSYTIRLKSDITLYLEQGAVLIAADPVNGVGFDAPEPDAPYIAYQDW